MRFPSAFVSALATGRGPCTSSDHCDEESEELEDGGVGHPAALTHRLQAVADAGVGHVVKECGHQPRTGAAEGMAERDGTPVGVQAGVVGADLTLPAQGNRGERLVDLVGADVVEQESSSLE